MKLKTFFTNLNTNLIANQNSLTKNGVNIRKLSNHRRLYRTSFSFVRFVPPI